MHTGRKTRGGFVQGERVGRAATAHGEPSRTTHGRSGPPTGWGRTEARSDGPGERSRTLRADVGPSTGPRSPGRRGLAGAALALALLLAATAVAKPAAKRAPGPPPKKTAAAGQRVQGVGQVTFVTAERAYLDRGTGDGLEVGESVQLTRRGGGGTACKVEAVGDHVASCVGEKGIKVGDHFAFSPPALPKEPAPLVEPPSPDLLGPVRSRVQAAALPLHDFEAGSARGALGLKLDARFDHTSWLSGPGFVNAFNRERVDVALRDLELLWGIRLSADLSALAWATRPANSMDPYAATWQLQVRQVEISYRVDGRPFAAALGRINPLRIPGLTVLDGAQVAWRSADGNAEAGAYGGALPDQVSLTPLFTRWTAGLYGSKRFVLNKDALLQPEVRVGFTTTPGGGPLRIDGQAALHLHVREVMDGHLEVLAGGGGVVASPGFIDAVRLDLSTAQTGRLRGSLGARYWGGGGDPYSMLTTLPLGHWVRGDLRVGYEVLPWLELAARGAGNFDLTSQLLQLQVGPELVAVLLDGMVAASLSYDEEIGWLRGRSTALQLSLRPPGGRFRLTARASYFQQQAVPGAEGFAQNEFGGYLAVQATIWRFIWARASLLGRFGVEQTETGTPIGVTGNVALGATW